MAGIRFNRHARQRWRTVAVFAMLPLAVLNSRTVVGCGCTGHFEAVCHCNCGSGCDKCDGTGSCPCCKNHSGAPERPNSDSKSTGGSTAFHGHHCKGAVHVEVVPATVVLVHSADQFSVPIAALNVIVFVAAMDEATLQVFALEHSSPPPHDIVLTLHRLVI